VLQASIEKTDDLLSSGPGVILIDPWLIAAERGLDILRSSVRDLPSWVLPLLVADPEPDARAVELAERTRAILQEAGAARSEAAKRAIRGVKSVQEFAALMPVLVAEAERQYLRHGPVLRTTARPGSRPRLTGGGGHPDPVAPLERSEEEPDG
jgi:FxsC-like protein